MNELISVVIPVYNVEPYLAQCVQSVLQQSYTNLEILLIDDGSTDNSGILCDELAATDNRIRVVHKKNEGLSAARNSAVQHIRGDYVLFIDSDDYIDRAMIEVLYRNILQYQADVSSCGVMNVYTNKQTPQCEQTDLTFVCDRERFIKELLIGEKIPGTVCNKLLRAELVRQIEFPVGRIYEDAFYHLNLVQLATTFVVTTEPYYYYFHRNNSITTTPYTERNIDVIDAYTQFYDFVKLHYPMLETEAFFRLSYSYFVVLDKMLLQEDYSTIPEYVKVLQFLKKNAFKIARTTIFRKGRRIAALALKINVRVYRYLLLKDIQKNKGIHK